jgi:hypothetical protein
MEPLVLAPVGRACGADTCVLLDNSFVRMNALDWFVLFGTILFIVLYGVWRTRGNKNIEGYLKGDNSMKWWMIGVSIMATQASAITFLSTPGQAIEDGMRFLQFYFWTAHCYGNYIGNHSSHLLSAKSLYCLRVFRNSL